METKICTWCKFEKDISCFNKKNNSNDGFHPHCKECRKEKRKIYYENNKEKILNKMEKYYIDNRKEIIEKNTEYYKKIKII